MLGALAITFIITVFTSRYEFGIMALMFTFSSFIAVVKDVTLDQDTVMLLYLPIIAMGMFSVGSFFKVKVR